MGRTVISYRQAIEKEIEKWKGFRKGLRAKDAEAFDLMMNACRNYASAGSMATRPVILEAMLMSILLQQQKAIMEIKERIGKIEQKLHQP
jgi:hypothetical protein